MQTQTHEAARILVDHVAGIEESQRWPTAFDRLTEASQQFGQLCLEAAERECVPDIGEVVAKLGQIHTQKREPSFVRNQAYLFRHSIGWLNGGGLSKAQRRLQIATTSQIDEYLVDVTEKARKFRGLILGNIGELAVLGAVNFMDDPNYFAMVAPPHHEAHPKSAQSYDLMLLDSGKKAVQKIQVKFGCQNLCEHPAVSPHKANEQGKYSHDIALMSGHCDTGMQYDQTTDTLNLDFAKYLSRSVRSPYLTTNDEFDFLFHVGDTAIENLTGAELKDRLGIATGRHRAGQARQLAGDSSGISPRARRKALRDAEEQLPHGSSRQSKGFNNNSRKARRKYRGGRAADFAY